MKYKQSIGIVCYNTADMANRCIKHIIDTQNIDNMLFILTNPGSIDNSVLEVFESFNVPKIIISMSYEEAYNNHYALAAAINDQIAITKLLGIKYFIIHDVDAFMTPIGIDKMEKNADKNADNDVIAFCGISTQTIHKYRDGHIIFDPNICPNDHNRPACENWTIALVEPNNMINRVGWFCEAMMPHYDIDNDINLRLRNSMTKILMDDSIVYDHATKITESMILNAGIKPIIRSDGVMYQTIYVMMWGGPPHNEKYKYPFNNPKFSHGVSYDLMPIDNGMVSERAKKWINI